MEPSCKNEVVKRLDKEKMAASAAPVMGRKPEDTSVSPPLKAMKFEKYIDEVPSGGEGTEHLLTIPEGMDKRGLFFFFWSFLPGNDKGDGLCTHFELSSNLSHTQFFNFV